AGGNLNDYRNVIRVCGHLPRQVEGDRGSEQQERRSEQAPAVEDQQTRTDGERKGRQQSVAEQEQPAIPGDRLPDVVRVLVLLPEFRLPLLLGRHLFQCLEIHLCLGLRLGGLRDQAKEPARDAAKESKNENEDSHGRPLSTNLSRTARAVGTKG